MFSALLSWKTENMDLAEPVDTNSYSCTLIVNVFGLKKKKKATEKLEKKKSLQVLWAQIYQILDGLFQSNSEIWIVVLLVN